METGKGEQDFSKLRKMYQERRQVIGATKRDLISSWLRGKGAGREKKNAQTGFTLGITVRA